MNNGKILGTEKITKLLTKFAIPSIIAMLVSSLYNIVDQFFIGRRIGELGNAATNISFPLSILCVAIALLFGIGGSTAFNISMGKSEYDPSEKNTAAFYMGNSVTMLLFCGLLLTIVTQLFLRPLMKAFGAPANVFDYAVEYTRITSIGYPFLILTTGGGHLIRADGSPRRTMLCNITGAVINTGLDALFVFVFDWGMTGAATATVIGQLISSLLTIFYLRNTKSVKLKGKYLRPQIRLVGKIASYGAAPCTNQLAMMVVQIVMNNSLKYYGAHSIYGEAVPIACAGIISKVNMLYMSFIIGFSQGCQPIASFNIGAQKYTRVKKAYFLTCALGMAISIIAFSLFHFIPKKIISIFGNGSELYYKFAIKYFRVFMFFTFINFIQPITSNFFTAIGKPVKGILLSLTRQVMFLLPLIIILPLFTGIDGIMYSGPVADLMAALACVILIFIEFRQEKYKKTRENETVY